MERPDFLAGGKPRHRRHVWRDVWRHWRAKRRKAYQCEECGQWLRRDQVVELTAMLPGELPGEGGGVTASYCKAHAPQEGQA